MIESPCVRNCCLDDKEICIGCLRSLDEILRWNSVDDVGKREILLLVEQRKEEKEKFQK